MHNLQNLHTHTVYCDGKNTPEEMVRSAIENGFEAIGFSGHAFMPHPLDYGMTPEKTKEYKREIARLKVQYADQIHIYCGLETDVYSDGDLSGYDYLIGSAHCIFAEGDQEEPGRKVLEFDGDLNEVRENIIRYYNGDGLAYARSYYKTLEKLGDMGNIDIIGHFDLVTKYSDRELFFDTASKEYRKAALEAAWALAGKIPYFEVNTGAMARGYKKAPYPELFLINELKDLGFGAVITSDCHDARHLSWGFQEARELLIKCGFKERFILTPEGFAPTEL